MGLFKKAERSQAYLKAGLFGFAGSGKTRTATEIATGLVKYLRSLKLPEGNRPAFFIDTETGADYVERRFTKEGIELHTAKTRAFSDLIPAVDEAERNGAVLIIDSITHFWREFTETYARKKHRTRGLEFSDWAFLKTEWGKFTDRYVNSRAHIVMCGRAGYEFDFFKDESGKKQLEKTGVKMRAETETGYEPSLLVLMEQKMSMATKQVVREGIVIKERFGVIDGKTFYNPTFDDFLPHIELLNLGGQQLGIDTSRTSEDMIPESEERYREKTILLEEFKAEMVLRWPGQSEAAKAAKSEALHKIFNTRSWTKVETMQVDTIREGLGTLRTLDTAEFFGNSLTGAASE